MGYNVEMAKNGKGQGKDETKQVGIGVKAQYPITHIVLTHSYTLAM